MERPNLVGNKYSMLTVISFNSSRKGRYYWNCKCDCGNNTVVCTRDLRSFRIKSCGCLIDKHRYKKHGLSNSRLYHIYRGMKGRCCNPNNKDYKNYGGRGIKICNEWLDKKNGFINFVNWALSNGYKDNLSIDRINVNGDYCPSNCHWASIKEQGNNTRKNTLLTYNGQTKTLQQWSEFAGINKTTLRGRILRGWSLEDAFNIPCDSKLRLSYRKTIGGY